MFDAVLYYGERATQQVNLESFGLHERGYSLCMLHRQENTDDPVRLSNILKALTTIARDLPVVLPLHPRTKAKLQQHISTNLLKGLNLIEPVPYLEMQRLQTSAKLILTDSGDMQKEAYFHQVTCITLRNETEWMETVSAGWNQLAGANKDSIIQATIRARPPAAAQAALYGDGHAAENVAS